MNFYDMDQKLLGCQPQFGNVNMLNNHLCSLNDHSLLCSLLCLFIFIYYKIHLRTSS